MAFLLDPEHDGASYFEVRKYADAETTAGTFKPLSTARTLGRIYGEAIQNLDRPLSTQSDLPRKLAEAAEKGLPDAGAAYKAPEGAARWFAMLVYRVQMNNGNNTLGRGLIALGVADELAKVGARRAASRNLVRAALLLRMGRLPSLPDPYGSGNLRIDPRRRLVWSVGENGKDDGGRIGTPGSTSSPDCGYRY